MVNKILNLTAATAFVLSLASCNAPSGNTANAIDTINDTIPALDTMLVRVAECGAKTVSLIKDGTYGNEEFTVFVTDSTEHNGKFFPNNLLKVILEKDSADQYICKYYANADDNYTYSLIAFAGKWAKEFPSKTKEKVTVNVELGIKGDATIKGMDAYTFKNWGFADLDYKSIYIKGVKELDGKQIEFSDTASIVDGQLVVKGGFTYHKVED